MFTTKINNFRTSPILYISATATQSPRPFPTVFTAQKHPFHILDASPFPALVGIFALVFLLAVSVTIHHIHTATAILQLTFISLIFTVLAWFQTIYLEAGSGYHTKTVQAGLRSGVVLFIVSEVMFFFAFFWGFFHFSLSPALAIGMVWPAPGTQHLNAWGLPLLNTVLLLSSGVTVTYAHACILKDNHDGFVWALSCTIILGLIFLACQFYEYKFGVKFSFADNIFGSIFFITTGFHGLHVTIGTLFLMYSLQSWYAHLHSSYISYFTPNKSKLFAMCAAVKFTPKQHIAFEAAAWYWHFVDVVWLGLFIIVYWWGSA